MMTKRSTPTWLTAVATLLLPPGAAAQAVAPANAADPATVTLSPFEVSSSRDVGYTATTSLAGGRLATDLRDTPVSLTVLTREFLDDIGATTFTEAAAWAPNAMSVYDYTGPSLFNDYQVATRSLGGGFSARNYFVWYINSDSYNTERLDFARGPNSVVFGDANVGGMANISTKRAYQGSLTDLQYRNSNWGGDGRVTLDVNRAITDNWYLRINGLYDHQKGWEDRTRSDREGFFVTTTYRPFKNTNIRLDYEWGDLRRVLSDALNDSLSGWNGTATVSAPVTAGALPGGLTRRSADFLVFNSSRADLGIVNWRNFGATSGTGRNLQTRVPAHAPASFPVVPSDEYSFVAPNDVAANKYHDYAAFVEQRVGDNLFLEAAYNYQQQYRFVDQLGLNGLQVDVNEVLPGGAPNPYFLQRFTEAGNMQHQIQGNKVHDYRLSGAYALKTSLTDQRFLAAVGMRKDYFEMEVYRIGRVNNPAELNMFAAANQVRFRRYESEINQPWSAPVGTFNGVETRWGTQALGGRQQNIEYWQVAANGGWFRKRSLQTLVGVRRDTLERLGWDRMTRNAQNEVVDRGPIAKNLHQEITSSTFGLVYHLNEQISLFANRGESFQPLGSALSIDNSALPPLLNEGIDVGVRFNLFGNRVAATIAYYDNEQRNARVGGLATQINRIWDDLGRSETVPSGYNDMQSYKGSGVELDMTANITPSWRLLANLAFPETETIEGFAATQAYYNANVATWRSGLATLPEGTARNRVQSDIAEIENRITNFEVGRTLNNTFRYTANIFTKYTFREGPLRGLGLGGGVNFRGRRLVTNHPASSFDYIYANPYQLVTATASYDTKFFGRRTSLQLNISNLLDENFHRYTSYSNYTVNGVAAFMGNGYRLQDPRRISLTATVRF